MKAVVIDDACVDGVIASTRRMISQTRFLSMTFNVGNTSAARTAARSPHKLAKPDLAKTCSRSRSLCTRLLPGPDRRELHLRRGSFLRT